MNNAYKKEKAIGRILKAHPELTDKLNSLDEVHAKNVDITMEQYRSFSVDEFIRELATHNGTDFWDYILRVAADSNEEYEMWKEEEFKRHLSNVE